ncbi:Septum formation protein Maf [Methyloligella halotolerans]|uniref:Nucleoside triphosphate pyrophosphatase n=1 Tax=Methyloligella halotolerans TaxID=1177755 RepID=A0A1E2S0K2_9HYPH|nr:Maf family protein [Methyloligella halotolerans]ODA68033.1 Septum formation protein Maf [Methyloligella halotolerans]
MTSFLQNNRPPLILASSSQTRAKLIEAAGLNVVLQAPGLDEAAMREAISGEELLRPGDVAEVLARAKAEAISDLAKEAYVIGGDQVLALGDQIIGKSDDMEDARRLLLDLSGKTHELHTSVALAKDGEAVWAYTDVARLTMRTLSPEFIGRYLAAAGEQVLGSVGAYQLEFLGVQLFEKVEGNYFSILGLPLLPLLAELRARNVIEG